jgi:RHS repeat-associated protein
VLSRYQFTNLLDSSCLELDSAAAIISYEEYYPYGSTSYEAVRRGVEISPKRYRYTGQERDEETGFYCCGARYYASWIGRWTSPDKKGLVDGTNVYAYSRNNPINLRDPKGTDTEADAGTVDPSDAGAPQASSTDGGAPDSSNPDAGAPGNDVVTQNDDLGGTSLPGGVPPQQDAPAEPAPVEQAAPPTPVAANPIGESGVRLVADVPREHYNNFVASDLASQGYLNLAEIAEAGHGCAYCHIVKNYSTLAEANSEVDLRHYNAVSTFLTQANIQLAITLLTAGVSSGAPAAQALESSSTTASLAADEGAVTTFYHGTSQYTAEEIIENQAVNLERLASHQTGKSFSGGLYTTSQEETAAYYADLLFNKGRAGGPAILKIEVPSQAFGEFAAERGLGIELPVPRPPFPGQTETFIPFEHLDAFNNLPGIKFSLHY